MIIVDTALERREREGRPVRVGIVGAGYMGRGIARRILKGMAGMRLAGVANRTVSSALRAMHDAGAHDVVVATDSATVNARIRAGLPLVTPDPLLLCGAEDIDVIIEATGHVETSAHVAMGALAAGKHLVLMNAELDATVGPLLKVHAERAGVVVTNSDGDQPGVIMNLMRFVKAAGFEPVLAGNIKGLQDPYRTPETQRGFAEKYGQKPYMVTSFADGTKISMEMAVVANATGFGVSQRGMRGTRCAHVKDAIELFGDLDLRERPVVDYILGAEPSPGVFVLGYNEDPVDQQYMVYHKMGDGPLYAFYTPYHLCNFEAPITAARAVLFGDASITPRGGPVCDVFATAKRDLAPGDVLDGIGGFTAYGMIDDYDLCRSETLLPMGQAEGCILNRPIRKDEPITIADVEVPKGRLIDRLRVEQDNQFASPASLQTSTANQC